MAKGAAGVRRFNPERTWHGEALRLAGRLREAHPDMTATEIAARIRGVVLGSPRRAATILRWLGQREARGELKPPHVQGCPPCDASARAAGVGGRPVEGT